MVDSTTLEDIAYKITNLESIFITYKSRDEDTDLEYCLPLFIGLKKLGLKNSKFRSQLTDLTFCFDGGYGSIRSDNLQSFMAKISKTVWWISR